MSHGSTSGRSDEELAEEARNGSAGSFEELVRRYQVPLRQFLRRSGAGADAEDLVQEAFLCAYRNIHRYEPGRRFAPWLYTIARRAGIGQYRRTAPLQGGDQIDFVVSRAPRPDEEVSNAEDRDRFWKAAARILSNEEMSAVWLFYVEELSGREIARVLARSWVSVKTMLFRVRRKLAGLRAELNFDDEPRIMPTRFTRQSEAAAEAEVPNG
jgi:RNA polymerase sigma-70 factor, ECF subfamily